MEKEQQCPHNKDYQTANNKGSYDVRCSYCNEFIGTYYKYEKLW